MKFFEVEPGVIWGTEPEKVVVQPMFGPHKTLTVQFRIDQRKKGIYRVDRSSLLGWEAIDGYPHLRSLAAAKRHIARYLAAAREQETLDPRL